jgi:hypothetical protein
MLHRLSTNSRVLREPGAIGASDSSASAEIAAMIPRMTALMSLASAGMPRYAAAGIAGEKA